MGDRLYFMSVALYFLFLPLCLATDCDIGGTWSTWRLSPNQTGYDHCGSCWKAIFIRECLSEPDCPCSGPTQFLGEMNTDSCLPPRIACCPGYNKSTYNSIQACVNSTTGALNTPPVDETNNDTYCPPSGVGIWGPWSNWGACSADCGQGGIKKRTRICKSESYGCTCYESDVGPCQVADCPDRCTTSCSGPLVPSYDGREKYCYPFGETAPVGIWSEWAYVYPPQCNDTCGRYGVGPSTRECFPSGSVCLGSYTDAKQPCPPSVCLYPRISCKNPPYMATVFDAQFTCEICDPDRSQRYKSGRPIKHSC